jgi:uncharacterized membrane protein
MSNSTIDKPSTADRLTWIMGSWSVFWLFMMTVSGYLFWNTAPGMYHFDPYPFEFMTFAVSILANIQVIIVMISQRGQLVRDRKQQEIQHQTAQAILSNTEAGREMLAVLRDYILKEIKAEEGCHD